MNAHPSFTSNFSRRYVQGMPPFSVGNANYFHLPLGILKMLCCPRTLIYYFAKNISHSSLRCAPGRLLFSRVWLTPDVDFFSPNGADHVSLRQRPGLKCNKPTRALKGRPKPCRNPSPASTCIWFSAPRTANPSSAILSAPRCTPTWPPFSKTSIAIRSSSTRSKTTSTFFSNSPAPCPSVRPLKTSKNPHPNGSRNKPRNFGPSHGNRATASSPFPNPTSKPFGNTSPINGNTTARRPSRTNTGSSSNGIGSHSMKNTSGIDPRFGSPLQGSGVFSQPNAGALPRAIVECPFGASEVNAAGAVRVCTSAKGASHDSPGHRPGITFPHISQALKGRPSA
jgi:hypothetical protein